jgi:hypothetical protein
VATLMAAATFIQLASSEQNRQGSFCRNYVCYELTFHSIDVFTVRARVPLFAFALLVCNGVLGGWGIGSMISNGSALLFLDLILHISLSSACLAHSYTYTLAYLMHVCMSRD